MFHMLTSFDLKPGNTLDAFERPLNAFTKHLCTLDLLESRSAIGVRQSDTILDTDDERHHQYFVLMHFRDRAQSDKAVRYIEAGHATSSSVHEAVYANIENPMFICWQDIQRSEAES